MSVFDTTGAESCRRCGENAHTNVERLQAENAKLRDENARLRSCLSDDAENARMIMGENAKLRDKLEEQKCFAADLERDVRALRELVRDMWEFMTTPCNDYCERCVVAEECSERQDYDYCQWRDECVKRMRELGVGL